jgi:hypothetical protein
LVFLSSELAMKVALASSRVAFRARTAEIAKAVHVPVDTAAALAAGLAAPLPDHDGDPRVPLHTLLGPLDHFDAIQPADRVRPHL